MKNSLLALILVSTVSFAEQDCYIPSSPANLAQIHKSAINLDNNLKKVNAFLNVCRQQQTDAQCLVLATETLKTLEDYISKQRELAAVRVKYCNQTP